MRSTSDPTDRDADAHQEDDPHQDSGDDDPAEQDDPQQNSGDQDSGDQDSGDQDSGDQDLADQAAEIKHSHAATVAARVGLGSRAVIYGLLTIVVAQIAAGAGSDTGADVDQGSSLQVLGRSVPGTIVLWLLAAAVLCYAVWRWSEAWLGTSDPGGHDKRPRVQAAIEGTCYLPFGYLAVAVAVNDDQPARQGHTYMTLSGKVLVNLAGQVAVGFVGAVVIGVGLFFVGQGLRRTFRGHFDWDEIPPWARQVTQISGAIGSVGRGVIFVLAGALVIYAAVTTNPRKAGGIDSALDEVAAQPYGHYLLGLCAFGFAAFAVFAVCEAIWRRIR